MGMFLFIVVVVLVIAVVLGFATRRGSLTRSQRAEGDSCWFGDWGTSDFSDRSSQHHSSNHALSDSSGSHHGGFDGGGHHGGFDGGGGHH
jgi:hypothetical protein